MLVPRRVEVTQQVEADVVLALEKRGERFDGGLVLRFESYDATLGTGELHGDLQARDHLLGVEGGELLVHLEQWFALSAVDDHCVDLCRQLDMGGETGSAGPYDTCVPDSVDGFLGHGSLTHTMRKDPASTHRRSRVKAEGPVMPSPVGPAMLREACPSPPKPSPA